MLVKLIDSFADDPGVLILAGLIALDFLLGTVAAVKNNAQVFRLAYLADFLRNDVLGKLVPYAGLWVAVRISGDLTIPGLDVGAIEEGAFLTIGVALSGSILKSLSDLGLWSSGAHQTTSGPDPTTPV